MAVVMAKRLKVGDILSDGSVVVSIVRSEGITQAEVRRQCGTVLLVVPDTYLLGVTKPQAPDNAPEPPSQGLFA